jgi:two-component system, OmpR family, KDP operon response regulator KdpE
MTGHVLVCDPSSQTQRGLRVILQEAGYKVQVTATANEALARADQDRPRAVITEVELPDLSGVEVCRRLRQRGQMPILVLSSIDADHTKIAALEAGADDYVTKPFSPGELLARLAARLRSTPSELRFEADGFVIDLTAQSVTRDGQAVSLTATEFALLRVLVTSRGIVSHGRLAKEVWGTSQDDVRPRLRTHVRNLRAKLHRVNRPSVIRTATAIGYRCAAGDGDGDGDGDSTEAHQDSVTTGRI